MVVVAPKAIKGVQPTFTAYTDIFYKLSQTTNRLVFEGLVWFQRSKALSRIAFFSWFGCYWCFYNLGKWGQKGQRSRSRPDQTD